MDGERPDKGGETYHLSSPTPCNKKPPLKGLFLFFPPTLSNQAWSFVSPPSRENILKTAKALVEDTKLLVSGAASTPDKLAQAAQSSAATITQLAEVVKLGAASLGSDDPETQVWGAWEAGDLSNTAHQASEEARGTVGT